MRYHQNMHRTVALVAVATLFSACAGDLPRRDDPKDGSTVRFDRGLAILDAGGGAVDRGGPKVDSSPVARDKGAATPDTFSSPPDKGPLQSDTWTGSDDIGKTCVSNGDCMHGLCAQNTHTGVRFCTKTCDPCAPTPCPSGSGCQNAGIAHICAPGYPNAPCAP